MAHVYQEAQLWYGDLNARAVRKVCSSTELPWYSVLYGWLAQRWTSVNESHISQKEEPAFSYEILFCPIFTLFFPLMASSKVVVFDYGGVLAIPDNIVLPQFFFSFEKIELPAKDIIFIDNIIENVVAAKEAGNDAIIFTSNEQVEKGLQEGSKSDCITKEVQDLLLDDAIEQVLPNRYSKRVSQISKINF
ncbi:hypothetical protein ACTFIW_008731 [Dictyostelium discoideum]